MQQLAAGGRWNTLLSESNQLDAERAATRLARSGERNLRIQVQRSAILSIPTALKFRAEQMGYNQTQMAKRLGLLQSHYSEVLSGKIELPKNAMRKAYKLGVPAEVLLQ